MLPSILFPQEKTVCSVFAPFADENSLLRFPFEPPQLSDDDPFIVLTETKFSFRCIPVWIGTLLTGLGSKKKHM